MQSRIRYEAKLMVGAEVTASYMRRPMATKRTAGCVASWSVERNSRHAGVGTDHLRLKDLHRGGPG